MLRVELAARESKEQIHACSDRGHEVKSVSGWRMQGFWRIREMQMARKQQDIYYDHSFTLFTQKDLNTLQTIEPLKKLT